VTQHWILIDHETGLHVGWYFWLRVLDEVTRSARYGSPFALLMLEPETPHAPRRALIEAASRVADTVRGSDVGGSLGGGRIGVMLLEQDVTGAESAAMRIAGAVARAAGVSWEHALYCYPRDAFAISNLLTQGRADGAREQETA
jgi:GGDEF domain-containing protein